MKLKKKKTKWERITTIEDDHRSNTHRRGYIVDILLMAAFKLSETLVIILLSLNLCIPREILNKKDSPHLEEV